jgi:hypothetical protein
MIERHSSLRGRLGNVLGSLFQGMHTTLAL